MAITELLHAKMSLESKWNAMYTKNGVYSVEMKDIEKKIDNSQTPNFFTQEMLITKNL